MRTVERDPDVAVETITEDWEPLLGKLSTSTARFELTTPRQWGALKGSASLQVEIGHWAARQVVTGRCTWLDLDLLRALGPGLASRVWAALEAWAGGLRSRSTGARRQRSASAHRRWNRLASPATRAASTPGVH